MRFDRDDGESTLTQLLHSIVERSQTPESNERVGHTLRLLHAEGLDRLPLPGSGATLERWQRLARVAAADLALAKLYEAHTDAHAILAECSPDMPVAEGLWSVWAAEPPDARLRISGRRGRELRLTGRKAWCSGGTLVDHALVSAWDETGQPQLVAIRSGDAGKTVITENWQAVGMAATGTVDLDLSDYPAIAIGAPGQYVHRPGFWHGGMGIAACWYGAAQGLATHLHRRCARGHADAHTLAHLGAVDAALAGARSVLQHAAAWIDRNPRSDACHLARQVRAQVEHAVQQVVEHVGRALGATPFCRNSHFARLAADLPVFIRQSHAERDLAQLGEGVAQETPDTWTL